jgi:hypothetical protein
MRSNVVSLLAGVAMIAAAVPANAEILVAQAKKPTPREILAAQIKDSAYQFAANPSDYSLVTKTEALNWQMIKISEGLSSCANPTYDLSQRIEGFNATFIQMQNLINSFPPNTPKQVINMSTSQVEANLNGQKAAINKVLENVVKYCR